MKKLFNQNLYFFIPWFIFLIILLLPLILESKTAVHIFINNHHSSVSDGFFKYITHLGGGLFAVIITVLFLLVSLRKSLFILLTYIGGGLFVQILKRIFFSDALRPVKYLNGIYDLHLIEGVKMRYYLSFPSGHAATAFGLFLCLAVLTKNNAVKLICFFMATLTAFSRVYLSQHFLADIYFGSIIGVTFALFVYRTLFSSGKKWLDLSIPDLLKSGYHAKK
ncbi:MAG: phosphatase PAP2 family protein [Bacteroidales bacterium]|nr:phosphatase PAP2 family protein [Bacteroidales bacterium]